MRAYLCQENSLVNLHGDYRYLTEGYYLSQEQEIEGRQVHPTCKEALDAYIVPLFLEKGALAGLPVPDYYITHWYFEPPVLVDTINPFMNRGTVVRTRSRQERIGKSLTRNYTYAICCQVLSGGQRVRHFRAVLGWSANPFYRSLAASVWRAFGIPLARVRVLQGPNEQTLLSALRPLAYTQLNAAECEYVERQVQWLT